MKIKNLGWYITMIILFGIVFYVIPKYQIENDNTLLGNKYETIAYSKLEEKSLLSYKDKQLIKWTYKIDGKYFSKIKSQVNKIQNSEYYVIHYNPENKKDIVINYKKFVLNGNYKKTNSISLKKEIFNSNRVVFEYYVGGKKYERRQSCELKNSIDLEKIYLVKYKVGKPEIAYIYLDSIQ